MARALSPGSSVGFQFRLPYRKRVHGLGLRVTEKSGRVSCS
jgi:hypothetical protein